MTNRRLAILCAAISAVFVVYEFRLLAVVNYRKMTPMQQQWAFVAAIVFPFLAWAFAWGARRYWRRSKAPTASA